MITPKPVSILTKPSVGAFLTKDKTSPMYFRPWRLLFAVQDKQFRAQWKTEHPAYECRWNIHQLNQRQFVAKMKWYHSGIDVNVIARHERRQLRVIGAMTGQLWAAVDFAPSRDRIAA